MTWSDVLSRLLVGVLTAAAVGAGTLLLRKLKMRRVVGSVLLRLAYPEQAEAKLRYELSKKIDLRYDKDPSLVADSLRASLEPLPESLRNPADDTRGISQRVLRAEDLSDIVSTAVDRARPMPPAVWRRLLRSRWVVVCAAFVTGALAWRIVIVRPAVYNDDAWYLTIGQCFDPGRDWPAEPAVAIRPCVSPHRYQLFATTEYPDVVARDPTGKNATLFAMSFCRGAAFTAFTGQASRFSDLVPQSTRPEISTSAQGERRVLCYLGHRGGQKISGSRQYHTQGPPAPGLIWSLKIGQCFDQKAADDPAVTVKGCASPHQYQFYATAEYLGASGTYPGDARLLAWAEKFCDGAAFTAFTGESYNSSALDIYYDRPSKEQWADTDLRRILCSVGQPNSPTTWSGSAQRNG